MDIETYFRNKGPFPGLTRAEASVLGIPYPLQAGWLRKHGLRAITAEQEKVLAQLTLDRRVRKQTASARADMTSWRKVEELSVSTRHIRHGYYPIGSTPDPADPTARLEVCVFDSGGADESPVIYLSKYRGREVGERSVGLHPAIADDIAAMLRAAVSMARERVYAPIDSTAASVEPAPMDRVRALAKAAASVQAERSRNEPSAISSTTQRRRLSGITDLEVADVPSVAAAARAAEAAAARHAEHRASIASADTRIQEVENRRAELDREIQHDPKGYV